MTPSHPSPLTPSCEVFFNTLSAHIAILDKQGVILWVNQNWKKFARDNQGIWEKTGVGVSYLSVCEKAERQGVSEAAVLRHEILEVLRGNSTAPEVEYPCHAPEEKRWFVVRVVGVNLNGQLFAAVIHENITTRRILTDQMIALRRRLEEREQLAALAEWVGALSHEIRSPLSVILTRAGLMRRMLLAGKSRDQLMITSCEQIEKTVDQILQVTEGLISLFRDKVQETVEIVPVKTLLAEAMTMLQDRLSPIPVELPPDALLEGMAVECRRVQILQILTNLLRNAADAVENESHPRIRVEIERRQDKLRMAVMDNGPGVPPEVKRHLLRPGFSTKPRGRGGGLGLRISRTLAEAHGGTVLLDESKPFTTFVLELPLAQTQDRAA